MSPCHHSCKNSLYISGHCNELSPCHDLCKNSLYISGHCNELSPGHHSCKNSLYISGHCNELSPCHDSFKNSLYISGHCNELSLCHHSCKNSLYISGHCNELSPCHHSCKNLERGGYECLCKDGYKLHQNGFSCIQIGKCLTGSCLCSGVEASATVFFSLVTLSFCSSLLGFRAFAFFVQN